MYRHGLKYLYTYLSVIHHVDSSTENKLCTRLSVVVQTGSFYVVRAGLSPLSAVSTSTHD